ncbi:fibronectin type III domain-containing protein [Streptomyces virginiae]|uniref:fibronectin type III domain-containing protein n=1 Tax=Streptomyces virginiae TaxID=1961 RepID=UPI0036CCF310
MAIQSTQYQPTWTDRAVTPPAISAPEWYKASADGFDVAPPKRKILKGQPIPGGYTGYNEFQLAWKQLTGTITPTPQPGGLGSKPVESFWGIDGYHVYVAALPIPTTGPVPVPVPPTVPSLLLEEPTDSLVISGYWTPGTPPALPSWTPVTPNTAYAVIVEPILPGGAVGPKSAVLYLETGGVLPPPKQQTATLATPGSLAFQQGTTVPNPASGNLGIWHLEFAASQGAESYEVYGNSNPRPGMSTTIGLMGGDVLLTTIPAPAGPVNSLVPVRFSADSPFRAGDFVNLKVRAVRTVQDNLKAYSAFTAPLTTILPKTSKPSQPTSLRLSSSATATTVPVTWNEGTANPAIREYRLYESGAYRMSVSAPATSATVGGYTASSTYKLTVTAVNTSGESNPSSVLEGTTAPA